MGEENLSDLELVIFDMDGLIFDTERLSLSCWKKAGNDFGYYLSQSILLENIGLRTDIIKSNFSYG